MKMATLGEVCEVLDKKRKPITKRDRVAGPYPYYGATGILDYVEDWIFDERLILLGEDGAKWGRNEQCAFIIDGRTWVNNHAHVLNPRRDVVDDRYVTYYLNHVSLDPFISGTTIPKLTQKSMVNIQIPLPPLEEQKRIAGILDEADRVLKKTQALIDKYDELAQSLFLDMFGDPVTNPKGWEVKPLGSVIELVNGRAYKKDELLNEGTPVLRIQNLNGGQRWYFSDLDLPQSKYCHKGDLLFAWSASFGPYIFDGPKSIFHYHIWNCRIEKKAQIPFYFGLLKQLTDQIKSNSHGASMLHMTKGGMEQMEIIVPPDSVIAEFTELREKNATQRQGLIIEVSRAESLFNALLQKAFKGELT